MTTTERPIVSERYASATGSVDLTPRSTDADLLLAAGYAAAHDTAGALALSLYRMRETGDHRGFDALVQHATNRIVGRMHRPGRERLPKMSREAAREVSGLVLLWWLRPTCPQCQGRRHPTIKHSARLNYSHACTGCRGTGEIPVTKLVQPGQHEHAVWLVEDLNAMAGRVFADMARMLNGRMDTAV